MKTINSFWVALYGQWGLSPLSMTGSFKTTYEGEKLKKKVKPLTPQQTRIYLLNPEKFDINRLEANEMQQGNGMKPLAKIPQIEDRIRIDDKGTISLVTGRKTDEETGEIREETVELGGSLGNLMPGMMLITDEYHDYFDVYGELIYDPMRDTSSGTAATPAPQAPAPSVTQEDWWEVLYRAGIEHTPMFNAEIRNAYRELKGEKLKKRIEEELKNKNYVQIGELEFVRFPDVPKEKIRILPPNEKGLCPVEYIHDRWYDTSKKQMRNRKTRVGYVIDELPGILIPNRRYDSCFEQSSGKAFDESVAETLEEIRKENENRKQREEEERLRKEEEESYKALFGENNEYGADLARMHLEKILSEMHEGRMKTKEEDEEDYEEYEDVEEAPEENESAGSCSQVTQQEEEAEMPQRPSHFPGVSMEDERAALLVQILEKITESIKNQAKKHPDALINIYKARKINEILMEIQTRYRDSGYEDLLELIEEPHEVEENGQKYLTGMTYSDVEMLLCYYGSILASIHLRSKK